ncbi:expressed unknown protein [Seminavis robusta]|uniref:Uncharacterized protein n=1 Tax=Seminavis robusta TaxID=568900 RepID=A0A9N8F1N3_9STRA|nr:expressed unknown protein [Seminavis robusta]|eukprot:Sro3115_g344070.1 n/a (130) ;mRNA; r:2243-2632
MTKHSLWSQQDIWVQGVLPFLGTGQYAFVGAVNKQLNLYYKLYCSAVLEQSPLYVRDARFGPRRRATCTVTYFCAAFYNVSCAHYWKSDGSNYKHPKHDFVSDQIAKLGNLAVLQWAFEEGFPMRFSTS